MTKDLTNKHLNVKNIWLQPGDLVKLSEYYIDILQQSATYKAADMTDSGFTKIRSMVYIIHKVEFKAIELDLIGVVSSIDDGGRIEVLWPTGDSTTHSLYAYSKFEHE